MPDDVPPIETVEPVETVEEVQQDVEAVEDTVEALGEALLARMDAIDARLDTIETRTGADQGGSPTEPDSREPTELTVTGGGEPDQRPKRDHFWFRAVND